MDLFSNFLQAVNNYGSNYSVSNNGKQIKLRQHLSQCTYPDDTKFYIQKAIKQVFHVYPNFQTQILAFKQSNQQKRYIQLKSILQVEIRGKTCKVDYNMMIPNDFPKKAPYVRIINRNPEFKVDDFYLSLQSPSDPKSYILNQKLHEVKTWDSSKSIVNIIIESNDMFRSKFPFSKPVQNTGQSGFGGYGTNNGWGNTNTNVVSPWQQINHQQQPFNSAQNPGYGFNQPQNTGYNNGYNNVNVGMNNGFNGYNNNQPNNMYNNPMGNQYNNMPKPPIPFNPTNLTQTIGNGQKFVGQTKKILEKMRQEHNRTLDSVQSLDILNYSIQSEQSYLRKENKELNNFLEINKQNNSKNQAQSLVNMVKPKNQLSEQILDLISSIKARQDCASQLQTKFNDGEISFEEFIKFIRKIQELKFQEKVLVNKCVSVAQRY